ncbi:hypothetical protein G159_18360 [Planococcus glaciei CHR43]|nr:hypothetical protein G159_18360 [Planococcus glaciei CHR43]
MAASRFRAAFYVDMEKMGIKRKKLGVFTGNLGVKRPKLGITTG